MVEVISVKFKNKGKSYYFSPDGISAENGLKLIVETAKGLEIADCVEGNHEVDDREVVMPLRPVKRVATEQDLQQDRRNREKEKEAFEIGEKKIAAHGLEMKLLDVECNFEGTKTTFFFTADGRVDFRELVKDLASVFHNRIELRQIGVRDETKLLGGIGLCGRPYCCSVFLDSFQPVSTKMAKLQNLSLNPAKISGACGRLMCCLRYEEEAYEELTANVPKTGAHVDTPDGPGTAVQVNLLRQTIKVQLDGESEEVRLYTAEQLKHPDRKIEPEERPEENDEDFSCPWKKPESTGVQKFPGYLSASLSDGLWNTQEVGTIASEEDEKTEEIRKQPDEAGEASEGKTKAPRRRRRRHRAGRTESSGAKNLEESKETSERKQDKEAASASVQTPSGGHASRRRPRRRRKSSKPAAAEKPKETNSPG